MNKEEALKQFKFNVNYDNENNYKELKKQDLLYELWENFTNELNVHREITDNQVMTWKNPYQ